MFRNMNNRILSLTILFLVLLVRTVPAHENVRFKRLSIEDGLSQSTVEAIVQDHQGFMWFGTEDGLNRYDGYSFTKFKHDPDLPGSISGNNIWCLHVDHRGILWIGTFSAGLNRYDPDSGIFTPYVNDPADPHSISSNRIRSITEDQRGDLWVGTRDGGLNRLPAGSARFSRIRHDPDAADGLPSDNVRHVLPDSGGVLWIATNRGFSRLEVESGTFTNFQAGPEGPNSLTSNNVRHLARDRGGELWIATAGGITRFDPATRRFTNFRDEPGNPGGIGTESIRKTYVDRQGHLWICTNNGGLVLRDAESGSITVHRHDESDPRSLSGNSVRVAFQDQGGILWVGTIGSGLNFHDPQTSRYRHFRYDPNGTDGLGDPILWAVAEGPAGNLWFGTTNGVDRYHQATGRFEHHQVDPAATAQGNPNFTRSLTWDDEGRLWIGRVYTGVDIYDPADGSLLKLRHREGEAQGIASNNVRAVYQDNLGDMWIGSWRGGLDNYNPETGSIRSFRHDPEDSGSLSSEDVVSLLQDSDGVYWVATGRGLNSLVFDGDPAEPVSAGARRPRITRFFHDPDDPQSLSNSYVLSIHEARSGDLYFGTMLGLSRLRRDDRDRPVFQRYFMKDGLPNDVVYGILEDDQGRLWLSTNFGLSCFDPDNETFRNYDSGDGLLGNEYNTGAYARTAAGSFVFGGVGGASEFDPRSIVDDSWLAPVVLTGFSVFGKPAPLAKSLPATDVITLSYRDSYFAFEFASLDYSTPSRNRYAYMLSGLDKEWIQAGTRNFVGYNHVAPGSYTFTVRGTNGDGVWNEEGASVRIVITPPFWKTWWFILLVATAIGGGIAALVTVRVRQLLAIERLRSKIAADLHDDIGAGLTEITMMGHVITRKLPPESQHLVEKETDQIRTTARSLITGMSDIVWLIDPGRDSLYDLISRLSDAFRETLHGLGVNFRTENLESLKSARLKMEHRQHLLLIFKEAINNSLKYSGCKEIVLAAELRGKQLTMTLSDDGRGFDMAVGGKGNGLKNMQERAQRIGGEASIRSSNTGTVVEYTGRIA